MKCARRKCQNEVPKVALLHNDRYCSTVCFRAVREKKTQAQVEREKKLSENGAGAADRGGWRKASAASYERSYGKGAEKG
jgi:hypothetical protein